MFALCFPSHPTVYNLRHHSLATYMNHTRNFGKMIPRIPERLLGEKYSSNKTMYRKKAPTSGIGNYRKACPHEKSFQIK